MSLAQVAPLQPSKHIQENAPGVFSHEAAFIQGPKFDKGFDSHSFTSLIKLNKLIANYCHANKLIIIFILDVRRRK